MITPAGKCLTLIVITWTCIFLPACREQIEVESVSFYSEKLSDQDFRWHGPVAKGNRVPSLHAARALAYLGDPAVPALLDAVENKEIADINSLADALSEIGLPVSEFSSDIYDRRDTKGLREWWQSNKISTKHSRSILRSQIGLPSL